jgi:hypothetical protein
MLSMKSCTTLKLRISNDEPTLQMMHSHNSLLTRMIHLKYLLQSRLEGESQHLALQVGLWGSR